MEAAAVVTIVPNPEAAEGAAGPSAQGTFTQRGSTAGVKCYASAVRIKPASNRLYDREPLSITVDLIRKKSKDFTLEQDATAQEIGVCLTAVKVACRKLGIRQWPHRIWKRCNFLRESYTESVLRLRAAAAAGKSGEQVESLRAYAAVLQDRLAQIDDWWAGVLANPVGRDLQEEPFYRTCVIPWAKSKYGEAYRSRMAQKLQQALVQPQAPASDGGRSEDSSGCELERQGGSVALRSDQLEDEKAEVAGGVDTCAGKYGVQTPQRKRQESGTGSEATQVAMGAGVQNGCCGQDARDLTGAGGGEGVQDKARVPSRSDPRAALGLRSPAVAAEAAAPAAKAAAPAAAVHLPQQLEPPVAVTPSESPALPQPQEPLAPLPQARLRQWEALPASKQLPPLLQLQRPAQTPLPHVALQPAVLAKELATQQPLLPVPPSHPPQPPMAPCPPSLQPRLAAIAAAPLHLWPALLVLHALHPPGSVLLPTTGKQQKRQRAWDQDVQDEQDASDKGTGRGRSRKRPKPSVPGYLTRFHAAMEKKKAGGTAHVHAVQNTRRAPEAGCDGAERGRDFLLSGALVEPSLQSRQAEAVNTAEVEPGAASAAAVGTAGSGIVQEHAARATPHSGDATSDDSSNDGGCGDGAASESPVPAQGLGHAQPREQRLGSGGEKDVPGAADPRLAAVIAAWEREAAARAAAQIQAAPPAPALLRCPAVAPPTKLQLAKNMLKKQQQQQLPSGPAMEATVAVVAANSMTSMTSAASVAPTAHAATTACRPLHSLQPQCAGAALHSAYEAPRSRSGSMAAPTGGSYLLNHGVGRAAQ